jgi:photosystem II stability/assembly factor-like uncharacterized protein
MMDVPKIVLERLRGNAKPGEHPDADMLSAFAEQALGKKERLRVLKHLAQCRECREIVFVAQPEAAETQDLFRLATPFSLRPPILRWGALAVCVAVVATVTTRRFSRQKPEASLTAEAPVSATYEAPKTAQPNTNNLIAKLETPRPKPQSTLPRIIGKQSAGGAEADSKAPAVASEKTGKKDTDSLSSVASPAAPSPLLPPKLNDREQRDQDATNGLQGSAGNSVNGAAMNETVVVEARTASAEVAEAEKAKEAKASRMKAPAAASAVGGTTDRLAADKAVESEYAVDLRASLVPLPRWSLSPEGRLQRSFNGGRSWDTIPLSGKKTVLRALAATGPEIWVGGDAGALYHSTDSGQHWAHVMPAANGESLTADVIGIESTDTLHAKLTTSDHETWTTADAGQSWTRTR